MPSKLFGISLVLGGLLLILLNIFLTPLLPSDQSEVVLRTSTVYYLRSLTSGLTAIFLLLGCIGIYLIQRSKAGVFGTITFLVAFIGNSLIVCVEWSNLFVLSAVSQSYPEALSILDQSKLMEVGFATAAGLFALGWILIAVSAIKIKVFPYWIPVSLITGLVLIAVLGATPLGLAGTIIGNVVFGLGIVTMGMKLVKA